MHPRSPTLHPPVRVLRRSDQVLDSCSQNQRRKPLNSPITIPMALHPHSSQQSSPLLPIPRLRTPVIAPKFSRICLIPSPHTLHPPPQQTLNLLDPPSMSTAQDISLMLVLTAFQKITSQAHPIGTFFTEGPDRRSAKTLFWPPKWEKTPTLLPRMRWGLPMVLVVGRTAQVCASLTCS